MTKALELQTTRLSGPDGHAPLSVKQVGVRSAAWAAVVPIVLLHVYLRDEAFDILAGLYAGILATLALLALAYARPRTLPALPVMLVKFYISVGVFIFREPRMNGARGPIYLSQHSYSSALLGILVLALVATASVAIGKPIGRFAQVHLRSTLDGRGATHSSAERLAIRIIALSCVALYAGLTAYGESAFEFGAAAHVATVLLTAPLPLTLLWFDMERDPTVLARWLAYGSAAVYSLAGLGTGMLGNAMEPIVVLLVLAWAVSGRIPWLTLGAALAAALFLNGVKVKYREMAWHSEQTLGALDRAAMWIAAIDQFYGGRETETAAANSAESIASRLQSANQIAQVMEWVPIVVPHAGPDLWFTLPLEFVPRFLWTEKPVHLVEYNLRYTLTFGLQHESTRSTTSVALPPVADGYWRLGWWGVAIEGILLGALIGFYTAFFAVASPATIAVGTAFVVSVSAELHVFGILAGQLQLIVGIGGAVVVTRQLTALISRGNKARENKASVESSSAKTANEIR